MTKVNQYAVPDVVAQRSFSSWSGFIKSVNLRRQLVGFFQIRSAAPPEIILTLKLGRSGFGPSRRSTLRK